MFKRNTRIAESLSRRGAAAQLALVSLILFGCGNIRFFDDGTTPTVKIDPTDDRYKLYAKIYNKSDDEWPAHSLGVAMRADWATHLASSCIVEHTYDVYEGISPEGTFEFKPITFDDPPLANVSANCNRCLKDKCGGVVTITLIRASNNQQMPGGKTKYRIAWSKDGSPPTVVEAKD